MWQFLRFGEQVRRGHYIHVILYKSIKKFYKLNKLLEYPICLYFQALATV
jgi:hypothetical protein